MRARSRVGRPGDHDIRGAGGRGRRGRGDGGAVPVLGDGGHDARLEPNQRQHDDLHADKGHRAPIDVAGGDRFGRDAAHEEQREAEGRMEEAGLQIDRRQHCEPHRVDAEEQQRRHGDRDYQENDLKRVEEES